MTTCQEIREQLEYQRRVMIQQMNVNLFDSRADRLEQMARSAGRVTFGDILNPTPDPLAGLRAIVTDEDARFTWRGYYGSVRMQGMPGGGVQ